MNKVVYEYSYSLLTHYGVVTISMQVLLHEQENLLLSCSRHKHDIKRQHYLIIVNNTVSARSLTLIPQLWV